MKLTTRQISLIALLAAISVIARFFSFYILGETIRIAFDHIPILFAGLLLGPLGGAFTGIISDILGVLAMPVGGFFPGFMLSYALIGFIPGVIFKNTNLNNISLKKLTFAFILTDVIVSLFLNTFWLSLMFGDAYLALLPPRILARMIIVPIHIFFIHTLLNYVPIFSKENLFAKDKNENRKG